MNDMNPKNYDFANPGPAGIYKFDGAWYRKFDGKDWYYGDGSIRQAVAEWERLSGLDMDDARTGLFLIADIAGKLLPTPTEARKVGSPPWGEPEMPVQMGLFE